MRYTCMLCYHEFEGNPEQQGTTYLKSNCPNCGQFALSDRAVEDATLDVEKEAAVEEAVRITRS